MSEAKNRLHVVNWRKHGQDESGVYTDIFSADEPGRTVQDYIHKDLDIPYPPSMYDCRAARDCGEAIYFVNDDITFADGELIWSNDGKRKFKIRIEEVKE